MLYVLTRDLVQVYSDTLTLAVATSISPSEPASLAKLSAETGDFKHINYQK